VTRAATTAFEQEVPPSACSLHLEQDTSLTLLSGRDGFELDHQLGGNPSAVLYFHPLRFGPLAHLGAVHAARRCPASAPGWSSGTAPGPSLGREGQRLGMLGVQIDLILGTVQPETDSTFSLAAVEVVDEQGLYLLSHMCPVLRSVVAPARRSCSD
jgi:hypothetical protein